MAKRPAGIPTGRSPATEPWYRYAQVAMAAAVREEWELAADATWAVFAKFGLQGLQGMLQVWCDLALTAAGIPHGSRIQASFRDLSSDTPHAAEEVPAPVRWAADMVGARAAMDMDAWAQLLFELPPNNIRPHLMQLLEHTANMVRGVELACPEHFR